ncbi:UNVERIFIED_CONTAM: putative late blight resistance proteinR1B-8 [Sesamum calycinum]|uniref:Late blight resistance proteinR1B-8 n=1 Tax=Sesamum calycinum TaxID=2727403 RepID=A0AAW2PNA6_9LAMI
MKILLHKVYFFIDLFQNSSSAVSGYRRRGLESRIRDIAYNAEDVLESHLVDQLLSCREGESFIFSPPDLEKLIEDFDSANKEMMSSMEESEMQLKYRLMGGGSELEVIPIVGMGGIGKTTLARNLYKDRLVSFHFDVRAWAAISQAYNVQRILLDFIHQVSSGGVSFKMLEMGNEELGEYLYKTLYGRSYLIVLDDIWDVKFWDDVKRFFPDNNNGSRIIITTRALDVADYIGSGSSLHTMNLLNGDESWNLIHQKVFGPGETCSPGLESIGRKIAHNCRGLPLAITVIGGLLSQAERTQVFWEQVEEDLSSTVANNHAEIFSILSLSYNYLPYHLKPCLLYMSAFPEDYEIPASRLIKMCVAEGFLKPISGKSLEEAAKMYLMDLVDRNLIFIRQQSPQGNVKSYGIHDLVRELCMKKAYEGNFLFVKRRYMPGDVRSRRVCAHSIQDVIDIPFNQMWFTRSFLFTGVGNQDKLLSSQIPAFKLLRVLDILQIMSPQFPEEILGLINLRYLALSTSKLPSSMSTLWNLQILIFQSIKFSHKPPAMMLNILGMAQLRHIKFHGVYILCDDKYVEHFVVQDKLQSLSTIAISQLTERFLGTIPNLEKLGILCDEELGHVRDLSRLHKLHTLKYTSLEYGSGSLFSKLIFPHSLKKLTLCDCGNLDPDMNRIGKLPNLEILKLRHCCFESLKWEPDEGDFYQLRFLIMEKLDLKYWAADDNNFPRLEHLVIRHCSDLKEIPLRVGDIPTLKVIEVHECSSSVVDSARMIQEEQLELGNGGLEVRLDTASEGTLELLIATQPDVKSVTSSVDGKQSLESRIRDAASDAEDVLESHLVNQILSCSGGESFIFSPPVIEQLDTAKEEMMTIMDNNQKADTSSPAVSSSRQDPNPKNIIVGVGEDLIQLKDRLIGQPSKALQVIPIVGMGGIGKTTLARNPYDDPSVTSHFDTRSCMGYNFPRL